MIFDTMYHFLWTMYVFLKIKKSRGGRLLGCYIESVYSGGGAKKNLAFAHEPVICWVWKTRAEPTSLLDI